MERWKVLVWDAERTWRGGGEYGKRSGGLEEEWRGEGICGEKKREIEKWRKALWGEGKPRGKKRTVKELSLEGKGCGFALKANRTIQKEEKEAKYEENETEEMKSRGKSEAGEVEVLNEQQDKIMNTRDPRP